MHRAFFPHKNSFAEDKRDGSAPWQSWVCSSKKCQDCWGDGPNKDCVIATSAPGRIQLVMQYSNITLVEGDITGAQSICKSSSGNTVCLIATEVDITRYQAHLYLSGETPDLKQILNLGSITITQAEIAKGFAEDVLTMLLGHNGDELFQYIRLQIPRSHRMNYRIKLN